MRIQNGIRALFWLCLGAGFARVEAATVEDFVGVGWGASCQAAKQIMLSHPGLVVDKQQNDVLGTLSFHGGSYLNKPAMWWFFTFLDDRFCWGFVDFQLDRDRAPLHQCRQLRQVLTAKYGKPVMDRDSHPHSDPTWKDCQVTKPYFQCEWRLPIAAGNTPTATVRLFLLAKTMDEARLRLVFLNDALAAERDTVEKAQKAGRSRPRASARP